MIIAVDWDVNLRIKTNLKQRLVSHYSVFAAAGRFNCTLHKYTTLVLNDTEEYTKPCHRIRTPTRLEQITVIGTFCLCRCLKSQSTILQSCRDASIPNLTLYQLSHCAGQQSKNLHSSHTQNRPAFGPIAPLDALSMDV